MKTVGEFEKVGVDFVVGDKGDRFEVRYSEVFKGTFGDHEVTSFAWRDLKTKPDNPRYKIEVDIDNHRWRPSLNQGVAPVNPPEFKVGDLVECIHGITGKYIVKIAYIDDMMIAGYTGQYSFMASIKTLLSIKPYNPQLNELKDIIGTHDDPTECAKAILAAGYTK